MKKIILIIVALFCFSNFTIIEAKYNYNTYITKVKRSAKRSTRKFLKHHRSNISGKFKSIRTGKPLQGIAYYKK